MKTIEQIINEYKEKDSDIVEAEVYRYKDKYARPRLHGDFLEGIMNYEMGVKVADIYIMDEKWYEQTILANTDMYADFNAWYGNQNAKILVIIVRD